MADEKTGVEKVADLIEDIKICMLTTTDDDGRLVSRPMAVQHVRFDGDLWFATDGGSPKVTEIRHGGQVNAAFASGDGWVSLAGTAEVVQDRAKTEELWNPGLAAWFPDGPDTPGLTLIRVRAESAEYWDTPGSKVSTLIALVTSKVKGERPDLGENETVDLTGPGAPAAG